jgi:hypothetical protein
VAERLLKLPVVAEALGLHLSDVRRLIRDGRLKAKRLVCRGAGERPRLRVLQSALDEFIEALPDTSADPPPPTIRRRTPSDRRGTFPRMGAVTSYF